MTRKSTLRDLIEQLAKRPGEKCRVEGVNGLVGPRGPAASRRIVREYDGIKKVATLPNMNDDDVLSISTGRSICNQLGVDPVEYGFANPIAKA